MNPYVTFRDNDRSGELRYYILQRDFPHYLGMVVLKPEMGAVFCATIPGYNMWVVFAGTLAGNRMPSHADGLKEVTQVCLNMIDWFLVNRISKDRKRYQKWAHAVSHETVSRGNIL